MKLHLIFLILVSFVSLQANGQATNPAKTPAATTPPENGGLKNVDIPKQQAAPAAGANVRSNAKNAEAQQLIGAGSSFASGGLFVMMGNEQAAAENYGMAAMFYSMGALSFANGALLMASAGGAGDTANLAGYDGGSGVSVSGKAADGSGMTLKRNGPIPAQTQKLMDDLKAKGYSYNSSTGMINTPNGPVSASKFKDEKSMLENGIPKSAIEKMKEVAAKSRASFTVASVPLDSSGGGMGGGYGMPARNPLDSFGSAGGAHKDPFARSPASSVAGLQKNLEGEPIGVGQDNIFEMVSRAYQRKSAEQPFIK